MSTEYPILDNRPLNKWKVAELKEELERRNLATKGLKDDLVKRLAEAIRNERVAIQAEEGKAEEGEGKGFDVRSEPLDNHGDAKVESSSVLMANETSEHGRKEVEKIDEALTKVVDSGVQETLVDKNVETLNNEVELGDLSPEKAEESIEVKEENIFLKSSQMDADHNEPYSSNQVHEVSHNLGSESFSNDTLTINEKNELKKILTADNVQLESEIVRPEMVQPSSSKDTPSGGIVHPLDDPLPHDNQTLGRETVDDKSKSLEFSKKNDIADEMSVGVSAVEHNLDNEATEKVEYDNELNKMSVEKDMSPVSGLSTKQIEPSAMEKIDVAAFGEETKSQDDNHIRKATNGADGELLGKVNFDQSSANESMEEDTLETIHVDTDHNSSKVGEKTEYAEDARVDVAQHVTPSENLGSSNEHRDSVAALSEKRKFQDATDTESKEGPKRQRRWNSGSQGAPESQSPGAILSPKLKAPLQNASTKSNFTRSDSTLVGEAPKARVVPPSQKAPTTSLRIDHFLRPFTLKAVQELLAKTGKVSSFWMDHIKTHCYVTFSSVEEAIETRNAVYNLQWPTNGGRHLIADFVDPEEVKLRVEGPSQSATPSLNTNASAVKAQPPSQPPPTPIPPQQGPREHREAQHPPSRQLSVRDRLSAKEQLPRAPSSVPEKAELVVITLDDLFRKTKATPRIYYLPLTDEQVAAKLAWRKGEQQ